MDDIRDFFRSILLEPFEEGTFLGCCVGICMWGLFILVCTLIFHFLTFFYDELIPPLNYCSSHCIKHKYQEGYTTIYGATPVHHAPKYITYWNIGGNIIDFSNERTYRKVKDGDSATVFYKKGFSTHIKRIEFGN